MSNFTEEVVALVSPNTYKRYIDKLDAAISSSNVADAKDLQNEILAVFGSELDGLKTA